MNTVQQKIAHREVINVDAILGASKLNSFTKVRPKFARTKATTSNSRSKPSKGVNKASLEGKELIIIDDAGSSLSGKKELSSRPRCVRHGNVSRRNEPNKTTTGHGGMNTHAQQPANKKKRGRRGKKRRRNSEQGVEATRTKKANKAQVRKKTVPPKSAVLASVIARASNKLNGNKNSAKIVPHSDHGCVGSGSAIDKLDQHSLQRTKSTRKEAGDSQPEKAFDDRYSGEKSSFLKSILSSAIGNRSPREENSNEISSTQQFELSKYNHPNEVLTHSSSRDQGNPIDKNPVNPLALHQALRHNVFSKRMGLALNREEKGSGQSNATTVKIIRSKPIYSTDTNPNPSAEQCVDKNDESSKLLQKELLSRFYDDESPVVERKNNSKVDFVSDVKDSMRGHRQSIQKYKAMYEMPQKKPRRPSLVTAYRQALLDAFGLRQLFATELDENPNEEITVADANETSSDCFRTTDTAMLRPNISRAMNLVVSNDKTLVNMRISSQIKAENLKGMTLLFAAVMYGCHKTVLMLLRLGANVRHRDSANKKAIDYIDREEASRDSDLGLKLKLLTLCEQSYKILDEACSVRDWQLVELTIMGVEGFELTATGKELELQKILFCRVMLDGRSKGYVTEPTAVSDYIDFSSSRPYVFRLNKKLQLISGSKMEIRLFMGQNAGEESNILLSTWGCYCNSLLDAATKEGITGVFDLLPATEGITGEETGLSLHNRLLRYDSEYESIKKSKFVKELLGLIDGFAAWMDELFSITEDNVKIASLRQLLEIPHCRGLTILHAAVYLEDEKLVTRLLKLGVSPGILSEHGTPLDIAGKLLMKYPDSVALSTIKFLLRHSDLT